MTDPLAQINIVTTCLDNVGSGLVVPVYSGNTILIWSQYGICESNAYRQGGVLRNGIHRGDRGYCGGVLQCTGDFHQSVKSIRASFGAEKWIVGNGINKNGITPSGDKTRGLNVWRWQGTRFQWVGFIDPLPLVIDENDNAMFLSLVGDFAWARNAAHNGFVRFDLVTMTAAAASSMPPSAEQPDIEGFTYSFAKIDVNHMTLTRSSGVPAPGPTETFCPDDKVDRKQVMAIMRNYCAWMVAHPGQVPPIPAEQQFTDVAMDNPFRVAIDSAAAADIVAGKPVCDS